MIGLFRALRSAAAFLGLVTLLGLAAVPQRLLIWPVRFLSPQLAWRLSARLMQLMGEIVIALVRLGGAILCLRGRVPSDQPCLVLMNHQSLLDVPIAEHTCRPAFPRYVARRRYQPVPLIGLGVRLTGGVLVDPERDPIEAVEALRRAGRTTDRAVVVYPEGHRSRDGELGEFESAGIRTLLGGQRMPTYLIVADGAWRCRSLKDFILGMHLISVQTQVAGPFAPPAKGDLRAFAVEMRRQMAAVLKEMRSSAA